MSRLFDIALGIAIVLLALALFIGYSDHATLTRICARAADVCSVEGPRPASQKTP